MDAFKPTGIGQVAAKNVFKVAFSEALSAAPQLMSYDDYLADTADHDIFAGTAVNGSKSMIGGIGLTAAPSADWWPSSTTAGAAVDTASRLIGATGYCLLAADAPEADEELFFNIDYKFPSDASPSDSFGHIVAVVYQYSGAQPTGVWHANAGTEGSPSWTTLAPGIRGSAPEPGMTEIRPCDAGRGDDGMGDYFLTLPEAGEEHPAEIWLKDYEA